ncbi:MAG: class I SAM-dependent methyltransferase [Nostocoides sp.]
MSGSGSRLPGEVYAQIRAVLLDDEHLVRAIAAGRRKGQVAAWRRAELRWVDLAAGRRLQITRYDETQAYTDNVSAERAGSAIEDLLSQPFSNWHVETVEETLQLRVTRKGRPLLHRGPASGATPNREHDRVKERRLPIDDPVFSAVGITDERGRLKPSRAAKYAQVEETLRALDPAVEALVATRTATADQPLIVADLGCGNGYVTFALHRYLRDIRGIDVRVVGVDVKDQARAHNEGVAADLGVSDQVGFVVGAIDSVDLDPVPDVVVALHACDTATDDVLARAMEWESQVVLAAPCCHHDLAAQLRRAEPPEAYAGLLRHGILRERLADTLTDALRAGILRREGYRVDVIEFVDSVHTPRNTLIRALRTGVRSTGAAQEVAQLTAQWQLHPALEERLSRSPSR